MLLLNHLNSQSLFLEYKTVENITCNGSNEKEYLMAELYRNEDKNKDVIPNTIQDINTKYVEKHRSLENITKSFKEMCNTEVFSMNIIAENISLFIRLYSDYCIDLRKFSDEHFKLFSRKFYSLIDQIKFMMDGLMEFMVFSEDFNTSLKFRKSIIDLYNLLYNYNELCQEVINKMDNNIVELISVYHETSSFIYSLLDNLINELAKHICSVNVNPLIPEENKSENDCTFLYDENKGKELIKKFLDEIIPPYNKSILKQIYTKFSELSSNIYRMYYLESVEFNNQEQNSEILKFTKKNKEIIKSFYDIVKRCKQPFEIFFNFESLCKFYATKFQEVGKEKAKNRVKLFLDTKEPKINSVFYELIKSFNEKFKIFLQNTQR